MRIFNVYLSALCISLFLISGCTNEQYETIKKEHAQLKTENAELKNKIAALEQELDELKNGASRLFSKGKEEFRQAKYTDALATFSKLKTKHPESPEAKRASSLISKSQRKLAQIEAQKKREARQALAKIKKSLSAMDVRTDKVEGITWYFPKRIKNLSWKYKAPISLYIGKDKKSSWLRLKLYYQDEDWLFIKKTVAFIDGQKYYFSKFPHESYTHDSGGGYIWEWQDASPDEADLEIIAKIIRSKEALIRFYGQKYYGDRKVTQTHKRALQEALDAYKFLQHNK